MKVLIASDSFKDALDSFGVCEAIAQGIRRCDLSIEIQKFPLSDGGEGCMDVLAFHLGGAIKNVQVHDPLMRPIMASYLISADRKTAFIEMAKTCGLELLSKDERRPMQTSTFGMGEMILDAISQGVKDICISIGGSATNDAGMGMARALGYTFYDQNQNVLDGIGKDLIHVHSFQVDANVKTKLSEIQFITLCDVNNPLYGKNGAAYVFAKQKGASDIEIAFLDQGLKHFSEIMSKSDFTQLEGAGAAGGMGFGTMVFLNAKLVSGISQIMSLTNFEDAVKKADLVITGEGKIDHQTTQGKLINGLTDLASKYGKPVIALCGQLLATQEVVKNLGLKAAIPISQKDEPLDVLLQKTKVNLEQTAFYQTPKLKNYIV
jgi:glycerate 2-kinase